MKKPLESWEMIKLGKFVNFQTGKLNSNAAKSNGRYPFFTCSHETYRTDTFSFDADCILLAGNNANGIYPLKYFKGKFDAYQRTYVIRSRDIQVLDNRFLYYALSPKLQHLQSISTGAATKFLTLTILKDIEIEKPPIHVQGRVAFILSRYDDLIENNGKRIKILEQIAQMLYREWFINLRFPGHEKATMTKSDKGLIPCGWKVAELDDVVNEIIDYRGKTPKKLGADWAEDGVLALSALNIKQGRLVNLGKAKFVSEDLYRRWMKSELDSGDILMTSEAPLGQLYMLTEKKRYCLSQRLFSIRANPMQILPSILYSFLSCHDGQEQINARASGTTVLGIRQAELRQVPVLVPELGVQKQANDILFPLYRQIEMLQKKNANLRTTRDILLPKLISGEVSVEQIEAIAQNA